MTPTFQWPQFFSGPKSTRATSAGPRGVADSISDVISGFSCHGTNLESETPRESATKNQKLKPANQKLKPANQKPKSHESETKNRANQKLKTVIRYNIPRIRNWESETKKCESETKKSGSETKMCESEAKTRESETKNTWIHARFDWGKEILPPTYPHKGSNPPPPLNTMLKRILHLFIYSLWGIKSATPSGHYVEWDIAFNISPYRIKSATSSDHNVEWDITFN